MGALLVETDIPASTINLDLVFVGSGDGDDGDSFHGGLSFIQRMGSINTLFRALYSENFDGESPAATDGALFFTEISSQPAKQGGGYQVGETHQLDAEEFGLFPRLFK